MFVYHMCSHIVLCTRRMSLLRHVLVSWWYLLARRLTCSRDVNLILKVWANPLRLYHQNALSTSQIRSLKVYCYKDWDAKPVFIACPNNVWLTNFRSMSLSFIILTWLVIFCYLTSMGFIMLSSCLKDMRMMSHNVWTTWRIFETCLNIMPLFPFPVAQQPKSGLGPRLLEFF
jgi:hypothetical protein